MVADISLVVTAAGVLGAWISLLFGWRQSYRERLRQLESSYVERYWKILDQLSLDALSATPETCRPKVSPGDEAVIRRYIILCEDEIELRASGYITDATYEEWAAAIVWQFKNPMFKEVWEMVRKASDAKQTFPYENLKNLLTRADHDPLYDPMPERVSSVKRIAHNLKGRVRRLRVYTSRTQAKSPLARK